MDATQQLSAELFGRGCRLPLALWILHSQKERFYQSEPPREIAVPTALRQELARFVRAGLLDVERRDAENRVYYVRTTSPYWRIVETAAEVLSDGWRDGG